MVGFGLVRGRSGGRSAGLHLVAAAGCAVVLSAGVVAGGIGPAVAGVIRPAEAGGGAGAGTVTVFAGGAGGPAAGTAVALGAPSGVAAFGGHVVFTDPEQNMVRDLNVRTGWMRNVAGIGLGGLLGVGGPAVEAEPGSPGWVTVDRHGNVILTDESQDLVVPARSGVWYGRRMRAGHLYPLPVSGSSVAVDYAGNLVLAEPADQGSNPSIQVYAVSSGQFYGRRMTAGRVYTIARIAAPAGSVLADAAGNPVIEDNGALTVIAARSGTFDGRRMRAGHSYLLYQGVSGPAAVDRYGNFVLVNSQSFERQQLDVLATSTGTFYGRRMRAGHLYKFTKAARGFAGDGGPLSAAKFDNVTSVTVDADGNWVLADSGNSRIRVVAARSGRFYGRTMKALDIYTVAGTGSTLMDSGDSGPATRAELGLGTPSFSEPPFNFFGLASDPASNVYLADAPANQVRMIPAHSGTFFGQRMRAGDIYTIAGDGMSGDSGNGGLATRAELGYPAGVGTDSVGNVLFADHVGKIRVIAARVGIFYALRMRTARIYTIAGGGSAEPVDGMKATAASLTPMDVKVDSEGNVLISNGFSDGVWVLPSRSGTYYGQPMTAGDLYKIADSDTPSGLAIDRAGNILIAAYFGNEVQVVAASTGRFYGQQMTVGDTYTIAGGGHLHGTGQLATRSAIGHVEGVTVDQAGNVIMTVSGIRKLLQVVATTTGMFYGRQMTAGHLYTIGGGGYAIVPGNRPGTSMKFLSPQGIVALPSGGVVFYIPSEGRVLLIRT